MSVRTAPPFVKAANRLRNEGYAMTGCSVLRGIRGLSKALSRTFLGVAEGLLCHCIAATCTSSVRSGSSRPSGACSATVSKCRCRPRHLMSSLSWCLGLVTWCRRRICSRRSGRTRSSRRRALSYTVSLLRKALHAGRRPGALHRHRPEAWISLHVPSALLDGRSRSSGRQRSSPPASTSLEQEAHDDRRAPGDGTVGSRGLEHRRGSAQRLPSACSD